MALDDQQVGETLDYLGQRQPLASQRLTTLPGSSAGGGTLAPPVTGGMGGVGGTPGAPGSPMGVSPSAPGASPLAMAIAALKGGKTLSDLAGSVFAPENLGTRGDTGGVSLSDALRSMEAAGEPIPQAGVEIGSGAEALTEGGQLATGAGAEAAGLGLADALPFVGAAIPLVTSLASGGPKTTTQAANLAVDTAAAAAAPFTFGASEAASGIARGIEDIIAGKDWGTTLLDFGGLGMLTSFFGHEGDYVPKRQEASQTATADLSTLSTDFQQAGQAFFSTGDPSEALTALQTKFDARNPVRSYLHLDPALASSLGVSLDAGGNVQWGSLSPQQFTTLLDAFRANPALLTSAVQGSGDVGYLPQAQAEQVAGAAAEEARALLGFLIQPRPEPAPSPSAGPTPTPTPGVPLPTGPGGPQGALGFAQDVVTA